MRIRTGKVFRQRMELNDPAVIRVHPLMVERHPYAVKRAKTYQYKDSNNPFCFKGFRDIFQSLNLNIKSLRRPMLNEPGFMPSQAGWIEVICGGMFSGKTEELIRRARRAHIAGQKVVIVQRKI